MAPSARVKVLFGITRLRSKSMVLPKPWQRGHAPKGLLNENRRGSGSLVTNVALLAFEALREAECLRGLALARGGLEEHFAGLAIALLDGVNNAQARIGRD
jgi:hypothetical protein